VVKKLEWTDGGSLLAHRELEGGLVDVVALDSPALVTIQSGINAPRYSTLRAIRQAERHEIDVRQVTEQPTPAYGIRRMFVPPTTNGAEMIDGDSAEIARRIEQIIKERLG
jgi:electron transfer flavoprotein beta subunit